MTRGLWLVLFECVVGGFAVNRQTKKDRKMSIRSERKEMTRKNHVNIYLYISVWFVLQIQNDIGGWFASFVIRIIWLEDLMLRVKHTPCAINKFKRKTFSEDKFRTKLNFTSFETMDIEQWTGIKYDFNVSMENDRPISKLFITNKLIN